MQSPGSATVNIFREGNVYFEVFNFFKRKHNPDLYETGILQELQYFVYMFIIVFKLDIRGHVFLSDRLFPLDCALQRLGQPIIQEIKYLSHILWNSGENLCRTLSLDDK